MTKFVIANKNDLSAICGESLPIIVCLENHKIFIAMEYKCNVMTPMEFFSCADLSCNVYMCLPSGKVLDDCIQYFHTIVKKFKCIVMKPKLGINAWPVPFTVYKQIHKHEKVKHMHTSGISLVNCCEKHCLMVSSTNGCIFST